MKRWFRIPRLLWELPLARPKLVLLLTLASLIPASYATSRLELRTSFSELLPESRPSVVELRRVSQRLAGISTLIVVLEGGDPRTLERCVDELAPRLRQLGPRYVTGVDEGGRALRRFVESHKHLYASRRDLEALRDALVDHYDYEVAKRSGLDLGLRDEAPPPLRLDSLRARFATTGTEAWRGLGTGYYLGEQGRLAAIVVATPFEAGDPRAFELQQRIRGLLAELVRSRGYSDLTLQFTGNLATSAEERHAIAQDLAHVGILGVALVVCVVFLFFLRVRVLLALGVTIVAGCLWSFAAAYLSVGYLNSATGFLVSIIAGNGINFGIMLVARYLEARLRDRHDVYASLRIARDRTAPGTLTAALCASAAYGSLAITDFRGFRQFGIIAGAGMLLCWIASYTLLPALLLLAERGVVLREDSRGWTSRLRALYGRPFSSAALRFPRLLVGLGAVSGALSLGLAARYLAADPLEYDLTKIRNDASEPTSARQVARRVEKIVGRFGRDARALVTDRLDQVEPLVAELRRRQSAAPQGQKPFQQVVSAFDLLPQEQQEKISLLSEIVDRARRARKLHAISDTDWARIEPELPSELRPLVIGDLPRDIAWRFEEADGTRGRIVYLVPTESSSLNDARFLMLWADSFREVQLPNGEVIRGSGDPVIFADMLANVRDEAPTAIAVAVLATLAVILAAFGARRSGWLAFASVLLGLSWLIAYLALSQTHLNFLNFVALPISVGVGADYAVNVTKRYELEPHEGLHRVLVETGGSLVLCSLTTLLGYGALAFSINGAVRSFGIAAAVGELAMLFAALLVLPAILLVRVKRVRRSLSPSPV